MPRTRCDMSPTLAEPFRDPPDVRPLPVYDRLPSSFGVDQYSSPIRQ
jgi:hypothetical protein